MIRLLHAVLPLGMMIASVAAAETMQVSPNGSRSSAAGPAETFSGNVTVTPLFPANKHSAASGGQVEFAPGARSHWHTHPAGQMLVITSGVGWVQEENGQKIEVKPGDVIWTPPGVKHWHGAQSDHSMTHIAVTPVVNGKNVDWMEPVTDVQYR
jgi:quercetin dioxygenase-like cupin family protein